MTYFLIFRSNHHIRIQPGVRQEEPEQPRGDDVPSWCSYRRARLWNIIRQVWKKENSNGLRFDPEPSW